MTPSPASVAGYRLAADLAAACPTALGEEIALTGSVARGEADEDSDVEIVFWAAAMPPADARAAWLAAIGAEQVMLDDGPMPGGSLWATFRWRGVWIEGGWQAFSDVDAELRAILTAEAIGHFRVLLASILLEALPLRTTGHLAAWQARLDRYPDLLAERIIAANTQVWQLPHAVQGRWALCRRGELFSLAERLTWDVYNVLRVLFALNRTWEPDWKWLGLATEGLAIKPERLAERIHFVFSCVDPYGRVTACQELIRDTLALVPESPGIRRARATIDDSLHAGRPTV
jgi:hypothetical protein